MNAALLLLSLLFSMDDTIYIATDNSTESKIVISELKRDWAKDSKEPILLEMQEKKDYLSSRTIVVDRLDFKANSQYMISQQVTYPCYRIGHYSKFQTFDSRAFAASGTFTTTMYALHNNMYADVKDWQYKCYILERDALHSYLEKIISWGANNSKTDINEVYFFEEGYHEAAFGDVIAKYSKERGFPVKSNPILPPHPIKKFPWEKP